MGNNSSLIEVEENVRAREKVNHPLRIAAKTEEDGRDFVRSRLWKVESPLVVFFPEVLAHVLNGDCVFFGSQGDYLAARVDPRDRFAVIFWDQEGRKVKERVDEPTLAEAGQELPEEFFVRNRWERVPITRAALLSDITEEFREGAVAEFSIFMEKFSFAKKLYRHLLLAVVGLGCETTFSIFESLFVPAYLDGAFSEREMRVMLFRFALPVAESSVAILQKILDTPEVASSPKDKMSMFRADPTRLLPWCGKAYRPRLAEGAADLWATGVDLGLDLFRIWGWAGASRLTPEEKRQILGPIWKSFWQKRVVPVAIVLFQTLPILPETIGSMVGMTPREAFNFLNPKPEDREISILKIMFGDKIQMFQELWTEPQM